MKSQLLCTFSTKETLEQDLFSIQETYKLVYNNIYILQSKSNTDELYITYNIDSTYRPEIPLPNTILVHRKKEYNTLYTINALNELIKEENDGVLDKSFSIDWLKFKNSIILTNVTGTKMVNTRIYDIVDFTEKN